MQQRLQGALNRVKVTEQQTSPARYFTNFIHVPIPLAFHFQRKYDGKINKFPMMANKIKDIWHQGKDIVLIVIGATERMLKLNI